MNPIRTVQHLGKLELPHQKNLVVVFLVKFRQSATPAGTQETPNYQNSLFRDFDGT